ncbi:MAG: hypothetical protein ACLSAP_08535 [Oscillospiraceae bacterium]
MQPITKDDILPKPYTNLSEIVLEIKGNNTVVIQGDLVNEFEEFFKECLLDFNSLTKESPRQAEIASINLYFREYPAYYCFGDIGISKSGKACLLSYDIPGVSSSAEYITFPDDISEYLLEHMSESVVRRSF